MEHIHIRNDNLIVCNECPPRETHYPSAPSIAKQAMDAHERKMQVLRDMSDDQFMSYLNMRHQAHDAQRPRGEEFDKAGQNC